MPRHPVSHISGFLLATVRVATITVLLASNSLAAQSHALAEPLAIPFTVADGILVVPAKVGGTSGHLIFDTGAGLDLLPPSAINRLGGKPSGTFTAHRMTGERIDVPLFAVPGIALGSLGDSAAIVGGWDVLDSLHLDGILSINGFRRQPFTIDFGSNVLTLETAKSLAQRRAKGQSSPLGIDDYHGKALDLFATFRIGDQTAECELDTGSQSATVSLRYLTSLGIDTTGPEVKRRERQTIAGAREVKYVTKVPRIALASAASIDVSSPTVAFADIIYDCVIGTDFWAGRALTIDIAKRQLIVAGRAADD